MEFFREWTVGTASAIIFAALCEIIVPSGNMKKYVNLILGIILSITMLKPLADLSFNNWSDSIYAFEKEQAFISQADLDEEERKAVIDIYTKKLEEAVKNKLLESIPAEIHVEIEVSTKEKESFGEVQKVLVTVYQNEEFKDYRKQITNILITDFGVNEDNIKIKFKNG